MLSEPFNVVEKNNINANFIGQTSEPWNPRFNIPRRARRQHCTHNKIYHNYTTNITDTTTVAMIKNPLAIASVSLGQHPSHALPDKITAAAANGFSAVEIVYADLAAYAASQGPPSTLENAARKIGDLCATENVSILSLNPFKNFEGHHSPLEDRLKIARHWIEIAHLLKAKYVQVPSQFDRDNSYGNEDVMVSELQALADLAAEIAPQVGIAYEAVAWGCYVDTWQDSLRIVQHVDRPNFGLCLDSFHVAARLWGDNTAESGKREGDVQGILEASLTEFVKNCPMDRIFYMQLSDAERYTPPLSPEHRFYNSTFPPALTWSRHTRPFPLEIEMGGYMPVLDIAKAWLVDKKWKGYVSFEIFDWRMRDEKNGPVLNAQRGRRSWEKLIAAMQ
jgi:sugar phosphate isomerase/epimerase